MSFNPAIEKESKVLTQSLSVDNQSNLSASKTQKGYSKVTIAAFVLLAAAFIGLAYAEYKYRAVSFTISMLIGNPMLAAGVVVGLIIVGCAGYALYLVFNTKESKAAKIGQLEQQVLTAEKRKNDCATTLRNAQAQFTQSQHDVMTSILTNTAPIESHGTPSQYANVSDAENKFLEAQKAYLAAVSARDAALSS